MEQEIGCSRSSLWSGGGSSGFSHAHHAAAVAEATGDDGGVEGVEVGLSGEGGIEGGELLGGVEEHARDRGVACAVEGDLGAEEIGARVLEGDEWAERGGGEQREGGVGWAGGVLGRGRFEGGGGAGGGAVGGGGRVRGGRASWRRRGACPGPWRRV